MAGSSNDGDLDKECRAMFMMCVEKCAGKELSVADKSVAKSNAVMKLLKETFDQKTSNAVDATIFPKLCDKTTKKLTLDQFMGALLPALAQHKVSDQRKGKHVEASDPAVEEELAKLKKKIAAKYQEWMHAEKPKNAAVVDRLTDVKGYTGSHKERFDAETGKGKGMEGRVEKQDTSGYVGAYKGEGTYDKAHDG